MEAHHYKWVILTGLATTCFGAYAAINPRAGASAALKHANYLELGTQCIELLAYGYIWRKSARAAAAAVDKSTTEREIVRTRYYDWFITTALMLWTTHVIAKELDNASSSSELTSPPVYNLDFGMRVNLPIITMLLGGFWVELQPNPQPRAKKWFAWFAGSLCLGLAFAHLRNHTRSTESQGYVDMTIGLWILYGVCFIAGNDTQKNIGYTVLDVISKNINGVYIAHLLLKKKT